MGETARMKIQLSRQGAMPKDPGELATSVLRKVFEIVRKDGEVSLLLVDDPTIRKLNREYRGLDRPTDVLSFALNEGDPPDPSPEMWGDIVVSVECALRQAEEYGHSFEMEMTRLLIHGALHLLGYDHEISENEDERMRMREAEILHALQPEGRNRA